jgi:endonuclease/exonuclease/phosphatase family metal-dependent hydrolase
MTSILTWNIQFGRGADYRVDLRRTASVIREMGSPEILCLQEVARHIPDLGEGCERDQVAELAGLLAEYTPCFYPAVDLIGVAGLPRRHFGVAIFSRLPILELVPHLLPRPPDPNQKHMQRQALEAVIETRGGPLRVITTHLQYDSPVQRQAQVERLIELHEETCANIAAPPPAAGGSYAGTPRQPGAIVCGDFNLTPQDPAYARFIAPSRGRAPAFRDAWVALNRDRPHPVTAGVFDKEQWPKGATPIDFFMVTEDLVPRLDALEVNGRTDASDHQPLKLLLRD